MGLTYITRPVSKKPLHRIHGPWRQEKKPHSCIRLSSKYSTIPRSGNTVPQPPHDPRSKMRRKKRFRSPVGPLQPGTLSSTRASQSNPETHGHPGKPLRTFPINLKRPSCGCTSVCMPFLAFWRALPKSSSYTVVNL
jgi:hypothetical protein